MRQSKIRIGDLHFHPSGDMVVATNVAVIDEGEGPDSLAARLIAILREVQAAKDGETVIIDREHDYTAFLDAT